VTAVASHTKAQSSGGTPQPPGVASPLLTLIGAPLLVLTHDRKLLETLRMVADPAHEVYHAASEVDLAAALMTRHAGVVLLDIAALATPAGQLAGRLHAQFPDVVLIVAGACYLVDVFAAFLVPDFGKAIHGYITIPSIIAEVWTLGYLLVIGVNTKSEAPIAAASS